MTKGVLNPRWELAAAVARESGNETPPNIKRIMKEFNEVAQAGYSAEIAIACWRWLRSREEFPITEARIITTLKGSPVFIKQFIAALVSDIPPVYEADEHDRYVLKNGAALRLIGFVYKGGRLSEEKLIECGLVMSPKSE